MLDLHRFARPSSNTHFTFLYNLYHYLIFYIRLKSFFDDFLQHLDVHRQDHIHLLAFPVHLPLLKALDLAHILAAILQLPVTQDNPHYSVISYYYCYGYSAFQFLMAFIIPVSL